jgi:hypothetical protein
MPLEVHKIMIDFDLLTIYVVLHFQLIIWCHICNEWLKACTRSKKLVKKKACTRSKRLITINLKYEMGMAPLCHGRVTNDHASKLTN